MDERKKKMDSFLQQRLDSYITEAKRLCAQPSVSAKSEGTAECANLVAEILKAHDFRVQRVVVSGFKDSRVFYRKAILACAGKSWHQIAFEYPSELKARMDAFVASAAQALDNTQSDCGETVFRIASNRCDTSVC